MAGRYVKLLQAIGAEGEILITGGLSADEGLAGALQERATAEKLNVAVRTHPQSIYAGALGAALWGGFRHQVLSRRAQVPA